MKVVVVGSGIIGLATAYELARRDCEVVVVGDRPPGAGASVNNAGWIVPAESGPIPAPGLILQALRWMVRPDSPVYVRPSPRPSFLRFMLSMARACNARAYARAFEATAALGQGTMDDLDRWAADGLSFEMHREGELRVYVDPAEYRNATADLGRYERAGFAAEALPGDEARALVPELSDRVVGAIRFPDERTVRPAELVAALADRLRTLGVTFVEGRVTRGRVLPSAGVEVGGDLDAGAAGTGRVIATHGVAKSAAALASSVAFGTGAAFASVRADAAVIAAGAWSGRVAEPFGFSLPIRPGKGYSLDYVPAPLSTRTPLMLSEAHCVMTPLEGSLRVAGTMEFGGFDERVSATRVSAIRRAPGRYLRSWDPDAPTTPASAGLRPMTPDGLPVIGRLFDRRLFVAAGHAMLGLTLAPRTGSLLAEMILNGQESAVLQPFSPRRFAA